MPLDAWGSIDVQHAWGIKYSTLFAPGPRVSGRPALRMAATGIVVDDAVVSEFNEVKLGRVKTKFLIYKINDTKIVKETMGSAS